jgi:hypothetical protein
LNRQSEQFAREGVELSVSMMADHVGACAAALLPLAELIKAHVFAAARIHGDDTTVPVLAKVSPDIPESFRPTPTKESCDVSMDRACATGGLALS